jgi:hypothetical protein
MSPLIACIWAAGAVHLGIAAANVVAPDKLGYRENLAKLSPILRQIFIVHSAYIAGVLLAFSGLCFFFARDLAGASHLGEYLSGTIAVFWIARAFLQIFYYDPGLRKQNRLADVVFLLAFSYLGSVFAVAALRGLK